MSEWYPVSLLIVFVTGFVSGLIYAIRIYKQMEAVCDREWAKRKGMREREMTTQLSELPRRMTPILRQQRL
jgi:hypothetical protein